MSDDDNQNTGSKLSAPMRWPMLTGLVVGILSGLLIWSAMPHAPKKYEDVNISVERVEQLSEPEAEHPENEHKEPSHEETPAPAATHEAAPTPVIEPAPAAEVSMVAETAVVIADMGLNRRVTEAADKALPAEATMAVSAYATDPAGTATAFKNTGRDVWLQVAAQNLGGGIDPGPLAISSSLTTDANTELLKRQLNQAGASIVGIYVPGDAEITRQADMWRDIAMDLIADNKMIMDGTAAKVATALYMQKSESKISAYLKTDLIISAADGPAALQKKLADAIPTILSDQQSIVVITNTTPASMETVGAWVSSLKNKGIRLVPASRFTGLTGK